MKAQYKGLSFLQALTLIFIVLKLVDKIDWSWWWVLSPLWLPFVVLFIYFLPSSYREARAEVEHEERFRVLMAIKAQRIYEQRKLTRNVDTEPPTDYINETNNNRASVFNANNWE